MTKKLLWIGCAAGWLCAARGGVTEPDNIIYGTITFGGAPVTAADTNVTITAALQFNGPAIASYQMGSIASVGGFYSLRISLESLPPVANPAAVQSSQTVYLSVSDGATVRAQANFVVGLRGQITRLDLAGAALGQTSHPADNNPADGAISINEVVAYLLAWRTGGAWPSSPVNIPLSYAVRAGALWRGGEGYRLDSTVSGAPAWWINTNSPGGPTPANTGTALCGLPASFTPGRALTVTNYVTPAAAVGVFGVEDQPPAGWTVSSISDGGVFDAVNGKVKWGLFFDHTARALTYQVTPPPTAHGSLQFSGLASFDGLTTLAIAGQRIIITSSLRPLAGIRFGPGGTINISLTGNPGQNFVLEISTNLVNWQSLSTNVLDANGAFGFTDSSRTNKARFYRARISGS